jgi:trk system potassium uptake protein TrkH
MKLFSDKVIDVRMRQRGLLPVQLIVLYFLGAILIGTLLLRLPFAQSQGHSLSWLEALFTATSAICVTGLVVVDTGTAFSPFGQGLLLLFIQSGGLGILTLGTLVALASGRRVSFRERMNLQAQLNTLQVGGVLKLIQRIIFLTLALELSGTLLLSFHFLAHYPFAKAFYYALFHSISAFNNAGFSLYQDSFMRFVADPLLNVFIIALIVLGGLGFIVEMNMLERLRFGRKRPLSLHTRLTLAGTVLLIVGGTLILFALERANPKTLGQYGLPTQALASFFQAITPRTAGFNTLDYGSLDESSLLFTMLLMFIGASPGSTGGASKPSPFLFLSAVPGVLVKVAESLPYLAGASPSILSSKLA